MTIKVKKTMQGEKGFTLVELAIVMVIVGLLIGGILKGQEMIANAQVTATVAQLKGVDAATSTFRDIYDALPGDITNPDVRLANCADQCDNDGDGNSRIGDVGALGTSEDENLTYWAHLAAADLLSGIENTGIVQFGQGLPSAKVGGGFTIGFSADGDLAGINGLGNGRGGHYITLQGSPDDPGSDVLTASQAARIDRKMDDGNAATGSVIAGEEQGGQCDAGNGVYNEAQDQAGCSVSVRIQG